jgi:hypothetical protein
MAAIKTSGELLDVVEKIIQKYHKEAIASIKHNNHMNDIKKSEKIDKRIVDAVLVDFINRIGLEYGVDYAMYTRDLK